MEFFNMFKSPYLDEDDGVNLGGGGSPIDTAGQQTETQPSDTTGQGGQQQTEQEQMFKLKYNHEEKEIPYSQAVELAQKGMNYDKAVERAKQEAAQQARDSWIAEQSYVWHDKPISTEAEYKQALKEQELENKIRQQYSNVPEEIVNELVEGKRFREQALAEKTTAQESQKQQKMYSEFVEAYPEIKPDQIPPEVWADVKQGRNLTDAYARYENKLLKGQINGFQQQQLTQQANQKNAETSTGSAKANGKANQGYISKEAYDQNKGNQKWMDANYDNVVSSMKHWK